MNCLAKFYLYSVWQNFIIVWQNTIENDCLAKFYYQSDYNILPDNYKILPDRIQIKFCQTIQTAQYLVKWIHDFIMILPSTWNYIKEFENIFNKDIKTVKRNELSKFQTFLPLFLVHVSNMHIKWIRMLWRFEFKKIWNYTTPIFEIDDISKCVGEIKTWIKFSNWAQNSPTHFEISSI